MNTFLGITLELVSVEEKFNIEKHIKVIIFSKIIKLYLSESFSTAIIKKSVYTLHTKKSAQNNTHVERYTNVEIK